jgi:hypothetical protein
MHLLPNAPVPLLQATGILDLVSSIGSEATEAADPDLDVVKAAVMLLGDMCSCMPVSRGMMFYAMV